ncbi:MAG: pyridoxal phosphate-dependent aminotransferase [Planctomycetota bacterium]|nr:pyridoxal phosphate-dependent aminotransferase [Planctomycetota bacterium]
MTEQFLSRRALGLAPSATLAMGNKAGRLKAEGKAVISFSVGETGFSTPRRICEAAKCAIDSGRHGYTPVSGIPELREAIARSLSQKIGFAYRPSQVVVSPGGKYSLYLALLALVNPGDEVLIPAPYWVSYPEMVRLAGGVPIFVESREEEFFAVTPEAIERAITPRSKLLILNSPSNPSGQAIPPANVRAIGELVERAGLWCLSDEIYDSLLFDGAIHKSPASVSEYCRDHTVVVNGCSKTYAMTGWRLGWIGARAELAAAIGDIQSQTCSNPSFIAQAAAVEALNGPQDEVAAMRDSFDRRRLLIYRLLNDIPGFSLVKPNGTFYALPNISGIFGRALAGTVIDGPLQFCETALERALVAMVPGEAFGAPRHVRISYAAGDGDIEEGCRRLRELVDRLS